MKKFLQVIVLLMLCLIAFIPKAEFEKNPQVFLEALKMIYFEKHPGLQSATVTVGENKLGQIVVIIDQKKQEI